MSLDKAAEHFNRMDATARFNALLTCCHAVSWAESMNRAAPYSSGEALWQASEEAWAKATEADRLEAFAAHPKIGGDLAALRRKFASTQQAQSADWSKNEQSGVAHASSEVLERLSAKNLEYEAKFGFIFIVCATGKSAEEMLSLLEARLPNGRAEELDNAAREQLKITRIRLEKLA
jgi:2-oxo-4-hydroxy-4-carboxy-5-ureidoimidazoline decarboxylase